MELKRGCRSNETSVPPSDWTSAPLSRLCAFITKGSTPTTYGFKWEDSGVLFLRSECVSDAGLDAGIEESPTAPLARRRIDTTPSISSPRDFAEARAFP